MPKYSYGLLSMLDSCSIVRETPEPVLVNCSDKSDADELIQHFSQAGCIVRCNNCFARKTNWENDEGGFPHQRNRETEEAACKYMKSCYPHFITDISWIGAEYASLRFKKLEAGQCPEFGTYQEPLRESLPMVLLITGCLEGACNGKYVFWTFKNREPAYRKETRAGNVTNWVLFRRRLRHHSIWTIAKQKTNQGLDMKYDTSPAAYFMLARTGMTTDHPLRRLDIEDPSLRLWIIRRWFSRLRRKLVRDECPGMIVRRDFKSMRDTKDNTELPRR